jgi:tripartite-type tricarboxylate transporter receptor subunit TctC
MKQVYNTAPKDGTVIGSVVAQNVAAEQLYGQSVDFDLTKVGHIGAPSADKFAFYVASRTGVSKLDELIGPNAKPIVIGTVAPAGDPGSAMAAYLNTFFGAKIKNVSGYAGTAPIRLAIDSGEVDGYVNAWQSHVVTSKEKTDSGEWGIMLQWTLEPIPGVPAGVPTVKDLAKSDEQLLLGKLAILPNDFARPLFLPPGAPPDRLAALQAAFAKTMVDPDFRAEAARANLEINPQTPEQLLSNMREFFTTAEPIKAELKPIIAP